MPLGVVMMLTLSGDTVSYTVTDAQGYFNVASPTPGSFILVGMVRPDHPGPDIGSAVYRATGSTGCAATGEAPCRR